MVRKLKSIKSQFFVYLAYALVYSGLTVLLVVFVFQKENKIKQFEEIGSNSIALLYEVKSFEKSFLLEQETDLEFKKTGENEQLYNYTYTYNQLINSLSQVNSQAGLLAKSEFHEFTDSVINVIKSYNQSFLDLSLALQQRGNTEAGLVMEITQKYSAINNELASMGLTEAIQLNLIEPFHRYLITSKERDIEAALFNLDDLSYLLDQNMDEFIDFSSVRILLASCRENIAHLRELDARIGLQDQANGYLNKVNTLYQASILVLESFDALILKDIQQRILVLNIVLALLLAFITVVFLMLIRRLLNNIQRPLLNVKQAIYQLGKGNIQNKKRIEETNFEFKEISDSINHVYDSLKHRKLFVDSLLKQKFNIDADLLGKKDIFGKTLLALKEAMRKTRDEQLNHNEENRVRRYINEGLAKFASVLRQNNDDMELLGDNFIRELVKYLDSLQGSLFLINEDNEKELDLISVFAYDRKKFQNKTIKVGQGLVGTCALEKKSIYLSEIPENYVSITSGLGDAPPSHLLLVPIVQDNVLTGVIELASLNEFDEHQRELAENIAASLAATILAVRNSSRTAKLLSRSQQQAAEMAEQEEEMRQNMEELKATQEDMKRKQETLEEALQRSEQASIELEEREIEFVQQQKTMQSIVDNIPKSIFLKDKDLNYLVCNQTFASLAELTPEEIVGKTDFDLPWSDLAESYRADDEAVIKTGESKLNIIEPQVYADGSKSWLETSKIPIKDEFGEVIAVLGMFEDISERIKDEENLKQNMEELKNTQESMRKKQVELEGALQKSEQLAVELLKRETQINQSKKTLQDVFENIPKAVFLKDRNLKYITCNQAFASLSGFSISEVNGKDDFEMPWKDLAGAYKEDDLKVIATGEGKHNIVEELVDKEGNKSWVETSKIPIKDADNKVVSLLVMFEDVTQRLEKEDDLAIMNIFVNHAVYMIEYSIDGNVLSVSDKFAEFLGVKPESLIGKLHAEIFKGSSLETSVFKALKEKEIVNITDKVHINEKEYQISYNLALLKRRADEEGRVYNIIKI